jgi:hypothetical protein
VEPSSDVGLRPTQKPRDIVAAADAIFMLNFGSSEAGRAAEQKCTAAAGSDKDGLSECMARARSKVTADALRFTQDRAKNWWWQVLQKSGAQYLILHKIQFDFGDETVQSIVIKPKGKDMGMVPMANVPKQVMIEVPNDFTIAVRDPQHGRLVYEQKIGIAGK